MSTDKEKTSPSTAKDKPKEKISWTGVVASVISVSTLALALIGYGVSMSAEGLFGIPHAGVFDSPFDLVDLASLAVAQIVTQTSRSLGSLDMYIDLYRVLWPILLLSAICWLAASSLMWRWASKRKPTKSQPEKTAPEASSRRGFWKAPAVILIAIPFIPLMFVAVAAVIAGAFGLMGSFPLMGMSAGTSYINEWVLKPEKCLWHTNRDERLRYLQERQHVGKPTPVAICVAVIKDGKTIARGRVVFMTSKAVVLFDPNTGTTRKVPVADSIVETLPSLDVPVAASAPAAPPNPPAKPAGGRQPLQAAPRP